MFTLRRRWVRLIGLLIGLLCTFSLSSLGSIAAVDLSDESRNGNSTITSPGHIKLPSSFAAAPQKVYVLLKQLEERSWIPLPGYVGGREFQNRERRLPRGSYREYDVNPKRQGRGRDAERLVIEQRTGKAYYTGDHYRTFAPLN